MKLITILAIFASSLLSSTFVVAECTNNRNIDMTITKPDGIYTDHADGTVTDNQTGLMWQKCTLGLSGNDCATGTAQTFTWQAALAVANANADHGYTDWRLPNKNEMESLVENACFFPAINETVFPATTGGGYITSSSIPRAEHNVWYVTFSYGIVSSFSKSDLYHVRLVRGGQ